MYSIIHKNTFAALSVMLIIASEAYAVNSTVPSEMSFYRAKKLLQQEYYRYMPSQRTIYCQAKVNWQNKKGVADLNSAGYTVRKQERRARRVEWEHIVPAYTLAAQGNRPCWSSGGRKNCSKNDAWFKMAEGDMHNLFPAIGEINGDRSNYRPSAWNSDMGAYYGGCKTKVDFSNKQFEPSDQAKGVVARTYLYVSDTYDIKLSKAQRKLFDNWNKQFKAQPWECERHKRVSALMHRENKYVAMQCARI